MRIKKNKTGRLAIEILIMLVVMVVTSAAILLLVRADVIAVNSQTEGQPILNTDFLPSGRDGFLAITNFQFCQNVNENYVCESPQEEFRHGDEVHFLFSVETSTYQGELTLSENYRLIDPQGTIVLDVEEKNNLYFDLKSSRKIETVTFKDFFLAGFELIPGEYTLELILENPVLTKKVTTTKKLIINE